MKSILISIQPKYCKTIVHDSYIREDAYGAVQKLEVRKTKPKVKLPIDVYIYCCEPQKKLYRQIAKDENGKPVYKKYPSGKTGYYIFNGGHAYPPYNRPCSNGKVFAKFTLNKVVEINYNTVKSDYDFVPFTGLYKKDAVKYANGKRLFGWRIDDLVIFDKPKELSEYKTQCKEYFEEDWDCGNCEYSYTEYSGMDCPPYSECKCNGLKPITKPPQSWQYMVVGND